MKFVPAFLLLIVGVQVAISAGQSLPLSDSQWPTYGGDPGGQRYSASTQINRGNVRQLKPAWTFHTGDVAGSHAGLPPGSFEATPILFKGSLYLTSPVDEVFSIDPETGVKHWAYDPGLDRKRKLDIVTSRGVASWSSSASPIPSATACADRIFVGTLNAQLIALDAATGKRCTDFGQNGSVDLNQNVDYVKGDIYAVTSPPTVVGDVVVVGAGIEDNLRVDVELGDVRGFDVRTGKLLWTWEPIPWAKQQKLRTGAANTWGVIAADVEHEILYLPASSPSPDYWGGTRPGDDRDADSIVAVDARTGKKLWAFQVVHHDLWDYDIAAEPLLFTFRGKVPAVAVSTKMGMVFVFNRLTGEPLYPITERAVPQSDVPGEITSPTQPFPALDPLSPLQMDMSAQLGVSKEADTACRKLLAGMRYEGIYTPPSVQGTMVFPGNVGGVNWGSAAFDPVSGILYANVNRAPFMARLKKRSFLSPPRTELLIKVSVVLLLILPLLAAAKLGGRRGFAWGLVAVIVVLGLTYKEKAHLMEHLRKTPWLDTGGVFAAHFGKEYGDNKGAPYSLLRQPIQSPDGVPCSPPPWGTVSALNLNTGTSTWNTPLGTKYPGLHTGTMNVGGPIVTAGGLVFTTASQEPFLRAFNSATGEEIWRGELPVPSQATPMTYTLNGKQYVVVSAGGHYGFVTESADEVVAFALP